jgi:hypothetical protein
MLQWLMCYLVTVKKICVQNAFEWYFQFSSEVTLQVLFVKNFIMIVYFRVPHRMVPYLYQVLPVWNVHTVGFKK